MQQYNNGLQKVDPGVIQKVYRCLFQAIDEDYQEADSHLNLKTHISKPYMIWDFINRNLMVSFLESNVLYSTHKRGMWEVLLLYDKDSNLVLSFMKDARFKYIKKAKRNRRPQYVRALLLLNDKLQAETKQQKFFIEENIDDDKEQLKTLLASLCSQFTMQESNVIDNHVLVVFSSSFGQITSIKAYILDNDLDKVDEQDWLHHSRPIVSNIIEQVSADKTKQLKLTEKSKTRRKQKDIVALKASEEQGQK